MQSTVKKLLSTAKCFQPLFKPFYHRINRDIIDASCVTQNCSYIFRQIWSKQSTIRYNKYVKKQYWAVVLVYSWLYWSVYGRSHVAWFTLMTADGSHKWRRWIFNRSQKRWQWVVDFSPPSVPRTFVVPFNLSDNPILVWSPRHELLFFFSLCFTAFCSFVKSP